MKKKKRKKILLIALLVIAVLIIAYVLYFFVYLRYNEPKTNLTETNTDPAVYDTPREFAGEFGSEFEKWVCEFNGLDGLSDKDIENGFYVVPGLKATKTLEKNKVHMCTSMVPQGLAVTDDYMFISAYCYTHKHNSVMYMMDIDTGDLIKTIVLSDKSHVGGLAYDDQNEMIWIAGKVDKKPGVNGVYISTCEAYDEEAGKAIAYKSASRLEEVSAVSFLSYEDGFLIAGTFDASDEGQVCLYDVSDQAVVDPEPYDISAIDYQIQGFDVSNGYVGMSQSYGQASSRFLIFKDSLEEFLEREKYDAQSAKKTVEMAQKLEQISMNGDRFYMLFESGALAYRDRGSSHVDRVIALDVHSDETDWR